MSDFLQSRIDSTKTQIIGYENAAIAFADNGALQSYRFDSGQDSQTVTRAELGTIQRTIDALYNRLNTLERRAGITGGNMVVPKW